MWVTISQVPKHHTREPNSEDPIEVSWYHGPVQCSRILERTLMSSLGSRGCIVRVKIGIVQGLQVSHTSIHDVLGSCGTISIDPQRGKVYTASGKSAG